jgi:hypothetical protein
MARRSDPPAPSPLDQLIERLARDGGPPVLDLRGPLLAAKAGGGAAVPGTGPVWRKTDTHWTDRAAFIAYEQLMRTAAARVKDPAVARALAPAPPEDFDFVVEQVPGQDLAQMLGVAESMRDVTVRLVPLRPRRASIQMTHRPGEPFPLVTSRVDDPSLPRLVMTRDSFMAQSIPLIAEHFSRATYVWNFRFDPELIEREKPAVVIDECVERLVRVYAKEQLSDFVPVEDGDIVLTDAARARPAPAPAGDRAPAPTAAPTDAAAPTAGAARGTGTLEAADATQIAGWAWDPERPDEAVSVRIEVDGRALPPVVADVFRQDLVDARKGNGCHGFLVPAPPGLGDGRPHTVTARVAGGADLFQSPMKAGAK